MRQNGLMSSKAQKAVSSEGKMAVLLGRAKQLQENLSKSWHDHQVDSIRKQLAEVHDSLIKLALNTGDTIFQLIDRFEQCFKWSLISDYQLQSNLESFTDQVFQTFANFFQQQTEEFKPTLLLLIRLDWFFKEFLSQKKLVKSCMLRVINLIFENRETYFSYCKENPVSQAQLAQLQKAFTLFHQDHSAENISILIISTLESSQSDVFGFTFDPPKDASKTATRLLNRMALRVNNKPQVARLRAFMTLLHKFKFILKSNEELSLIKNNIASKTEELARSSDWQTSIELGLEALRFDPSRCSSCDLSKIQSQIWKKVQLPQGFNFSVSEELLSQATEHRTASAWLSKTNTIFGDPQKWLELVFASPQESSLVYFVRTLLGRVDETFHGPLCSSLRGSFKSIFQMLQNLTLNESQVKLLRGNPKREELLVAVSTLAQVANPEVERWEVVRTLQDLLVSQEEVDKDYNLFYSALPLANLAKIYWGEAEPMKYYPLRRNQMFRQMYGDLEAVVPIVPNQNFFLNFYKFLAEGSTTYGMKSFRFITDKTIQFVTDLSEAAANPSSEIWRKYSNWIFKAGYREVEKSLSWILKQKSSSDLLDQLLLSNFVRSVNRTEFEASISVFETSVQSIYQIPRIDAQWLSTVTALYEKPKLAAQDVKGIPNPLLEFLKFVAANSLFELFKKTTRVAELLFHNKLQNLDGDLLRRLLYNMDSSTQNNLGSSLMDLYKMIYEVKSALKPMPTSTLQLLTNLLTLKDAESYRNRVKELDVIWANKSELMSQTKSLESATQRDQNYLEKFFQNFSKIVFYFNEASQGYTAACLTSNAKLADLTEVLADLSKVVKSSEIKLESELDHMSFHCESTLQLLGKTYALLNDSTGAKSSEPADKGEITKLSLGFMKIKQLYSDCLSSLKILRDYGAIYDLKRLPELLESGTLASLGKLKDGDITNEKQHVVIKLELSELAKNPTEHAGPLEVFQKLLSRAKQRHFELMEKLRGEPAAWVLQFTGMQLQNLAMYANTGDEQLESQVESILNHAARANDKMIAYFSDNATFKNNLKSPLSLEILKHFKQLPNSCVEFSAIPKSENSNPTVRLVGYEPSASKYRALLNFVAKITPNFPAFAPQQFLFCSSMTRQAQIDCFLKHSMSDTGKYYVMDPQLLTLDMRGYFISHLSQLLLRNPNLYHNASHLVVFCPRIDPTHIFQELSKQQTVFLPYNPIQVNLAENDTDYSSKIKLIESRISDVSFKIVHSKFAGLGKTHWIHSKCPNVAPLFISGEVSQHTIERRLQVVRHSMDHSQSTGLLIKIDMIEKLLENCEIVDHLLFQIVFLRSVQHQGGYFCFKQLKNIFLELGNGLGSLLLENLHLCRLMNDWPTIKNKCFHSIDKVDLENLSFSTGLQHKYLAVLSIYEDISKAAYQNKNTFEREQWQELDRRISEDVPFDESSYKCGLKKLDKSKQLQHIKSLFLGTGQSGSAFEEKDATMSQLVSLVHILYQQFKIMESCHQLLPETITETQANSGVGLEIRTLICQQILVQSRIFIWSNTSLLRQESQNVKQIKNLTGTELQTYIKSYENILHSIPSWNASNQVHMFFMYDSLKILYRVLDAVPRCIRKIAEMTLGDLVNHDQFNTDSEKTQSYFAVQLKEALGFQFDDRWSMKIFGKPMDEIRAQLIVDFKKLNPTGDYKLQSKYLEQNLQDRYLMQIKSFDGGKGYSLNKDNYVKAVLIMQRAAAGLPVVMIGATGCGKTYLTRFLVQGLLMDELKYLVLHTGISELDIETFILDAISVAQVIRKRQDKSNRVWVFLDEFNTCPLQSLIEELVVSRTCTFSPAIRQTLASHNYKLPDNMLFITACNPLRGKLKDMDVGLIHESADSFFSHRVHPVPEGLLNFAWDFGQLPNDIETDHMRPILNAETYSPSEKHNLIEAMSVCHSFLRENGDETVCLRDAERVKIVYRHLIEFLKPLDKDSRLSALACTIYLCYFLRIGKRSVRSQLEAKIRSHAQKAMKFDTEVYGETTPQNFDISALFKFVSQIVIQDLKKACKFPRVISINTPLKETIFALLTSILTKIPLLICGRPGTSKTLSASLVKSFLSNLTDETRKETKFFKRVPAAVFQVFNGSQITSSVDILKFHQRCLEHSRVLDNNSRELNAQAEKSSSDLSLKIHDKILVFLFDELGLAEIGPDNPLKVLHSLLEPVKREIAFVGISNWKLDQSKMSRTIFVARPDPEEEDLIEMFDMGAGSELLPEAFKVVLCKAYTKFQENEALEKILQDELKKGKALAEEGNASRFDSTSPKYQYLHPDFFGLRDFYNLIKFIFRHINKLWQNAMQKNGWKEQAPQAEWKKLVRKLVLNGIERSFSGKMSRLVEAGKTQSYRSENLFKYFFAQESRKSNDMPKMNLESMKINRQSSVTELINQNLLDDECRYLMLFTENPSINDNIREYLFNYFILRGYESSKIHYISTVHSSEERAKKVQDLPRQIEEGHVLILYQTDELNTCLFEVQNNQRVKHVEGGSKLGCELHTGGEKPYWVTIHEDLRIVMLMDRLNDEHSSQKQPAPFLNRFEKQLVVYEDLISENKKVQQEMLRYKMGKLRNQEFGRKQVLLHGYNEEILHSLILKEQHENLLENGRASIEEYINRVVFEEISQQPQEQKLTKLQHQDAINSAQLELTRLFSRDMFFYLLIRPDPDVPVEKMEEKFIATHPFESFDQVVSHFTATSSKQAQDFMQESKAKIEGGSKLKNLLIYTTTQSYETIQICEKHKLVLCKRVQEYSKLAAEDVATEISQLLQKICTTQIVVFLFETRKEWARMPEMRRIVDNIRQSESTQVIFIAHYTYQELASPNVQMQTSITFSSKKWELLVIEDLMGSNYNWFKDNVHKSLDNVFKSLQSQFQGSSKVDFSRHTDLHLELAEIVIRQVHKSLPAASHERLRQLFSDEAEFFHDLLEAAFREGVPEAQQDFLSLLKKDALLQDGSFMNLDFEISFSNWIIKHAVIKRAEPAIGLLLQKIVEEVSLQNVNKCFKVGQPMEVVAFKNWVTAAAEFVRRSLIDPVVPQPVNVKNPFLDDDETEDSIKPEDMVEVAPKDEPPLTLPQELAGYSNQLMSKLQDFRIFLNSSPTIQSLLNQLRQQHVNQKTKLMAIPVFSPPYYRMLEQDKKLFVPPFEELLNQVPSLDIGQYFRNFTTASDIDKFAMSEEVIRIYLQIFSSEAHSCIPLLMMRLAFSYFRDIKPSQESKAKCYASAMVLLCEIFADELKLINNDIFQEAHSQELFKSFKLGFFLPISLNFQLKMDARISLSQTQGSIQELLVRFEALSSAMNKIIPSKDEASPPDLSETSTRVNRRERLEEPETINEELKEQKIWTNSLLKILKFLSDKENQEIQQLLTEIQKESPSNTNQAISKQDFVVGAFNTLLKKSQAFDRQPDGPLKHFVRELLHGLLELNTVTSADIQTRAKVLSLQEKFAVEFFNPKDPDTFELLVDLFVTRTLVKDCRKPEPNDFKNELNKILSGKQTSSQSEEAKQIENSISRRLISRLERHLSDTKHLADSLAQEQCQDMKSGCELINNLFKNQELVIDQNAMLKAAVLTNTLKQTVLRRVGLHSPELEDATAPRPQQLQEQVVTSEPSGIEVEPEQFSTAEGEQPGEFENLGETQLQPQDLAEEVASEGQMMDVVEEQEGMMDLQNDPESPQTSQEAENVAVGGWTVPEIDQVLEEGIQKQEIGHIIQTRELFRFVGGTQQALEDCGLLKLAQLHKSVMEDPLLQFLSDVRLPEDQRIQAGTVYTNKTLPLRDNVKRMELAKSVIYGGQDAEKLYPHENRDENTWMMRILDVEGLRTMSEQYCILAELACLVDKHGAGDKETLSDEVIKRDEKVLETVESMCRYALKSSSKAEFADLYNLELIQNLCDALLYFCKQAPGNDEYRSSVVVAQNDSEYVKGQKRRMEQQIGIRQAEIASLAQKFTFASPIRSVIFRLCLPDIIKEFLEAANTKVSEKEFFQRLDDMINSSMNTKRLENFLENYLAENESGLSAEQQFQKRSIWTAMGMMDPLRMQTQFPALQIYLPMPLPSLDDLRNKLVLSGQSQDRLTKFFGAVLNVLEYREIYATYSQVLWNLKELVRLIKRRFDFKFTKAEAANLPISSFVGTRLEGIEAESEKIVLSPQGLYFDEKISEAYSKFCRIWLRYLKLLKKHHKFSDFEFKTESPGICTFNQQDLKYLLDNNIPLARFLLSAESQPTTRNSKVDKMQYLVLAIFENLTSHHRKLLQSFELQKTQRDDVPLFNMQRAHLVWQIADPGRVVELCCASQVNTETIISTLFGGAQKEFMKLSGRFLTSTSKIDFENYNYADGEPVNLRDVAIQVTTLRGKKIQNDSGNMEAYKTAKTIALKVNTSSSEQLTEICRYLFNSLEDFRAVDGINPESTLQEVFCAPPTKIDGFEQLKLKHLVHFITYLGRLKYTKFIQPQSKKTEGPKLNWSENLILESNEWLNDKLDVKLDMEITYWYYLLGLGYFGESQGSQILFESAFRNNWDWYEIPKDHSKQDEVQQEVQHEVLRRVEKFLLENVTTTDQTSLKLETVTIQKSVLVYLEGMLTIQQGLLQMEEEL